MYIDRKDIEKPNESAKVWRYTDLAKFLSLLHSRTLFFARSDNLGDPFEGIVTRGTIEVLNWLFASEPSSLDFVSDLAIGELLIIPEASKETRAYLTLLKHMRRYVFVSCWHLNEYESAAMWKLYLSSNEGISIQSTFQRLKECFKTAEDWYIGKVKYVDHEVEVVSIDKYLANFLQKRKSFEHEQELRVLIGKLPPILKERIDYTYDLYKCGGIPVDVDVDILIENVYVSPLAPSWFGDLVKSVLEKYELKKKVIHSSLADRPFY